MMATESRSNQASPPGAARVLLASPEALTTLFLIVAFGACAAAVPRFMDAAYLTDRACLYVETGIVALGMTFVIVGGYIDLSCASILALVAAACAIADARFGLSMGATLAVASLLGAVLGGLNGWLVAQLGLPSLVVTLATMAVYRGLAQVLLGEHSQPLPQDMSGIDRYTFLGLPVPLVALAVLAVLLGVVLHRTVFGRWVQAMGTSAPAARYAGIPIARTTIGVFVLNGVLSALAGLLMASRLGVARYDHALGLELDAITAVVLGGTSIFGGRGTIVGTVVALALVATIQTGMGVANIKSEYQQTANGALLIVAVLFSNLSSRWRANRTPRTGKV